MKKWEDHHLPSDLQAAGVYTLYHGTFFCVLGALLTLLGYLEMGSVVDLAPASQQLFSVMGCMVVGALLFRRAEERRWYGQLALSRLSDYQRQHGDDGHQEPVFGELVQRGTPEQVRWMRAAGMFRCCGGAFAISACFLPPPESLSPLGQWSLRAGLALLGVFWNFTGNKMLNRAVRHSAGVMPTFTPLPAGSYVLFLRNFSDDPRLAKPHRTPGLGALVRAWFLLGRSEEERIAAALGWAGPVVAVGMPGELAPNIGILRMYLPHDWQEPVRTLVRDARLVVLVLGRGPGTLWELGESMRVLPPERLVLVNPMKRAEYGKFRETARRELHAQADELWRTTGHRWTPPELPDPPADRQMPSLVRGIIHFTKDWEPTYFALPRVPLPEDYLLGALDRALWVPMLRLAAHERRVGAPHG
ncbi:hypothetical protein FXN61_15575 [Lentzea sp. PSKA42]|uniref:Uncharacterized protein n=1 Tax=Lentzea indica TaxID=2604800 RepID=A0ABX1FHQ8_9PSEU|nr:hypothetical protein [Lentzea indica]NKE58162.1 hypothetical protein [Lentzea indica]